MTTRFELFEDTAKLREILLAADWEFTSEIWGEKNYIVEIDGEEFYKVEFEDGSVIITDDPAIAAGEVGE